MNNGKICVSVCAETADDFTRNINRAEQYADVIELRLDCLKKDHVKGVVENLPKTEKTYLLTFRPREQGGKRDLTIGETLKFWEHVFRAHDSDFMIDIEFDARLVLDVNPAKTKRIVSFHDFDGTADDLGLSWKVMSQLSNSVVKIAVTADDITDALPVWKLLEVARAENKEVIPIAMGDAGKWTRVLGLAHGAYLTYAFPDTGNETAPGQITATDLTETYRVKDLDRDTQVFGVVGDPVSHSLSTYMHNPSFASSGINAVFIPLLVKDIDKFMLRMVRPETREVELNFGGFSVTMPHKQSIMNHLDAIDPTAEKIGAVNTVKIDAGKLTGFNTDAHGFITPLKENMGDLKDARVAVFGAGGAARACIYALTLENADVTVFARNAKKAKVLANEFGVGFSEISHLKFPISDHLSDSFDIIIDATPLGMKGPYENQSLFAPEELAGVKFVYDLVTSATDTPIIREAKRAGIPAIGGLEMLVAQGAKQFKIWTGREAPLELMKASVAARMTR